MKKFLSALFALLFITSITFAQTTYWSETFDAPAGGVNNNNAGVGWPAAGVPTPGGGPNTDFFGFTNDWTIGNSGLCSSGQNMYITNDVSNDNTYISDIQTDKLMASPTISNTGVTGISIRFTYRCNATPGVEYGQLGFSNDGGVSWNWLSTQYAGVSTCTIVTVAVPAIYENIGNFRFAFRFIANQTSCSSCDPPFNIDNIELIGTVSATNTITTGAIASSSFCGGATFNVPFTSTGTFNAGNNFTVQLSDASGSFASPTTIGTGASSPISVTIPGGTASGTGYLIRVVSSNPAVNGTASPTTITINQAQTLTVGLVADNTSVCPGTTVNFTATPGQTLTNASYVWTVGGVNQASTSSTMSALINNNNTPVVVTLTTTDACFSPSTASQTVTITSSSQPLTATVVADNDTICAGQNVTFNANVSPSGLTNSTYTWFVNNVQVQTGASSSFSTTTLTGTSAIKVTVTSSDPCLTNSTVTSTPIIVIEQTTPLNVVISVSPNSTPCPNAPLVFSSTITPSNATGLSYQWLNNNNPIAGQVLPTLNTTTYADGDQFTLLVTTNDVCVSGSPATSNIVTITYSSGPPASVTAVSDQAEICAGDPVTFTATPVNGGVAPTFQWLINGSSVPFATNPTFTSSSLSAGDVVEVVMTSSETCVSNNPDTSSVSISIIANVTPTATIREETKLCTNSPGLISVVLSPLGGDITWNVNGTPIQNPLSDLITNQNLVGDTITYTYDNIPGCVFFDSLTSTKYIVKNYEPPVIDIGPDQTITYGDQIDLVSTISPSNALISWVPNTYVICEGGIFTCPNPTLAPTDSLNILVLVAADRLTGCTSYDSLKITVKTNYEIFIPSAFSPNGDGNNDVLYVRNAPKQFKKDSFLFRIYNEYGEKVFESENQEYGWDGKLRDKYALPGIYIYHLTGLYVDDKSYDQKGKLLLIR